MKGCDRTGWSVAMPLPLGFPIEPAADRSIDGARAVLWQLARAREWTDLSWSALIPALVSLGRTDIAFGRLAEGHIDALRILQQAGATPVAGCLYGVWASRSQGAGLTVVREMDSFLLSGTLPFASGVGLIDRALVTATVEPAFRRFDEGGQHQQLLLDVAVCDWVPDQDSWQTAAMAASRSFTTSVRDRPVPSYAQIGPADFYLQRRGFFPGGIGVAAVWVGAAARVGDLLVDYLSSRGADLGPVKRVGLGRIRTELAGAHAILGQGMRQLADGAAAELSTWSIEELHELATEVRACVGASVRRTLDIARELAGPDGLAHFPGLADAIADLDLYVRQQPADRDADELAGPWPRA
jgi:alkylation response protein AidB-like acyl-CoA dehydrogenase